MTVAAQNAMLKTLEEPAGRTLIILLTDQPDSLLPTIRSRCQLIRFAPLDEKLVAGELVTRGIDQPSAEDAAELAEGSLGLAMQWLSEGVVERAKDLSKRLDGLLAGRAPEGLEVWFKQAAEAYAAKQLEKDELGSKDQATRQGIVLYLTLAGSHLRKLMELEPSPDRLERICSAIDAIGRAERYLWGNVNTSLVFQQLNLAWERELAGGGR
jgi:DNA polymerase-3 subunit delta'